MTMIFSTFKYLSFVLILSSLISCGSKQDSSETSSIPSFDIQIDISHTSMDSAFLFVFKDYNLRKNTELNALKLLFLFAAKIV